MSKSKLLTFQELEVGDWVESVDNPLYVYIKLSPEKLAVIGEKSNDGRTFNAINNHKNSNLFVSEVTDSRNLRKIDPDDIEIKYKSDSVKFAYVRFGDRFRYAGKVHQKTTDKLFNAINLETSDLTSIAENDKVELEEVN